jgi:hypothetical protein
MGGDPTSLDFRVYLLNNNNKDEGYVQTSCFYSTFCVRTDPGVQRRQQSPVGATDPNTAPCDASATYYAATYNTARNAS